MVFYLLLTSVVTVLHLYLWRRLICDLDLPLRARWAASLVLALLGASIPVVVGLALFVTRTGTPHLTALGFGWFGLMVYLAGFLTIADAARGAARLARGRRAAAVSPRRVFVARAVAGSALLATGGIGAFGVRAAVWDVITPDITVRLPRLPRALDGYSIALLTDTHIGPMLDGRYLRQLVERTNRLRPDLVAIAGDLVDGRVREIGSQVAELRNLRARHGTFFVTGNHEYYVEPDAWIAFLQKLGVRVLMNEYVPVGDHGPRGARFDLAGVPDRRGEPDALAATRGRDPERELVMLAHQPVQISDVARSGAGLQLSGHTHGGQLLPFGAVARLRQPYLAGLHRDPTGTQIYVSCGAGFWGPPMRVLAPAEIAMIRLVAG